MPLAQVNFANSLKFFFFSFESIKISTRAFEQPVAEEANVVGMADETTDVLLLLGNTEVIF